MSHEDLIRQGQILKKKNERSQLVIDAKSALRSLINEAVYAQDKAVTEVNSSSLRAHLNRFVNAQAEIGRLEEEIRELEY